MCICAYFLHVMSMRYDPYYARFEDWTQTSSINRSTGINIFDMMYHADQVYQGDATLVLDTGLLIRISNSQLAIPDRTISSDGKIEENMNVRDLMLYSLQHINANDTPCVGSIFFTGAYLWVNHED
ncbi:hypothetical protein BDV96DRAFT_61333 [Lophiotrema nucula]|uniref:Uncharacterized protein n=1 Tax=Lophiotrema nucula TaxID=690887 RepID=A0A6A5ZB61_9PLEO|nr:hypothetical protein BDV96DRAFT_61333 [Lophiotrema nucula]